ncbi:uncharacterized protein LOC120404148 [Mauremys reevesii]|uniref:uncharacterized protein LOC120404148 n=1 Tax=Mauremys reevesii TaxID=260615 RepID=UPI00193F9270|nr:uncharacterized protein LOC120404148 [Mauremys reevesii]
MTPHEVPPTTCAGAAPSKAITGVCIALLLVMVTGLAIYCWRRRRAQKGSYSAVETPPEAPAGRRDKTRGEDTVLMGTDGVSDAGEGSEQQPLLPAQGREQSETQEQDGAQGTASSNFSGSKASDVGTRASSWNTQKDPESEGELGARDEEGEGAASSQAQLAAQVAFPAQPSTAVEVEDMALKQHSQQKALLSSQHIREGTTGSRSELGREGTTGPRDDWTQERARLGGDDWTQERARLGGDDRTQSRARRGGDDWTQERAQRKGTTGPSSELGGRRDDWTQ